MPVGPDTNRSGEPRPDRKGWMEDAEGNVWEETSVIKGSGHEYTYRGSDDFGDYELRASYEPDRHPSQEGWWLDDFEPEDWVASVWDENEVERFDVVSGRGASLEDAMGIASSYRYNEHRPDTEYDMQSENWRGR